MKELSIEEKAKRYDESVEKLRSLHDDYDTVSTLIDIKEELENIFPELKESEDESIRKRLIELLKKNDEQHFAKEIAWLEKQGEQKPFGLREECKDCQCNYAGECKGSCQMKRNEQKPTMMPIRVGDKCTKDEELSLSLQIQAYLNTASDELYAKGKPLYSEKRIEDIHKCMNMWVKLHNSYFYGEQKSVEWSEEDEKMLSDIIVFVSGYAMKEVNKEWVNFLKSRLPQKLSNVERNEKNWKPSDKQITALRWVLNHIPYNSHKEEISGLLEQLKKL